VVVIRGLMKRALEILGLDPRFGLLVILSTLLAPLMLGLGASAGALAEGRVLAALVLPLAGLPVLVPGAFVVLPHTLPGVAVVWSLCRAVLWRAGAGERRASQVAAGLAGAVAMPLLMRGLFGFRPDQMLPSFQTTGGGSMVAGVLGEVWIAHGAAATAGALAASLIYRAPFARAWPRGGA
jgi:hypothetical protein